MLCKWQTCTIPSVLTSVICAVCVIVSGNGSGSTVVGSTGAAMEIIFNS